MNHTKSLLVGTVGAASLFLAGTASVSANTTHKVVNNDTVWALSQKYGVSIKSIEQLNHISANHMIFSGQTVQIPSSNAKSTPVKATNSNQTANVSTYSVKAGDSLWSIAQAHNITVTKLRGLNNLSSSMIQPGQTLKVTGTVVAQPAQAVKPAQTTQPAVKAQPQQAQTKAQPQVAANHVNHSVVSGETLYTIANKYGVSVDSIRQANALQGAALTIGQSLVINNPTKDPSVQAKVQTAAPTVNKQSTQPQNTTNYNNNNSNNNNSSSYARSYTNQTSSSNKTTSQSNRTTTTTTTTKTSYSSNNTYAWGQCTWFVKSVAPWVGNYWGNGQDWAGSARNAGYTVNSTPSVGSVAVFAGGQTIHGVGAGAYNWTAAAGYGHVAYVVAVSGNSVTIQQGGQGFSNPGGPNTQTVSASGVQFIHR